jgi:hypothetical protein
MPHHTEHFLFGNDFMYHLNSRDFTKRQYKILGFLIRLSMGTMRSDCYIPRLIDFENCGIGKTKIKSELEILERAKVLSWDREGMLFRINHKYSEWEIPTNPKLSHRRYKQLIDLNVDSCTGM